MFIKSLAFVLTFLALRPAQEQPDYNAVEYNTIHIINPQKRSYSLGSIQQLVKAFGKAKVRRERNDAMGGYDYLYTYKGFETDFNAGEWEATTVTSSEYTVVLNNVAYKVGDHISKLKDQFPISYQHRNKYNDNVIGIMLSHKKEVYEAGINITYNSKGYITEIWIRNDNS